MYAANCTLAHSTWPSHNIQWKYVFMLHYATRTCSHCFYYFQCKQCIINIGDILIRIIKNGICINFVQTIGWFWWKQVHVYDVHLILQVITHSHTNPEYGYFKHHSSIGIRLSWHMYANITSFVQIDSFPDTHINTFKMWFILLCMALRLCNTSKYHLFTPYY